MAEFSLSRSVNFIIRCPASHWKTRGLLSPLRQPLVVAAFSFPSVKNRDENLKSLGEGRSASLLTSGQRRRVTMLKSQLLPKAITRFI